MIDFSSLTGEALSQVQTQIYTSQLLRAKLCFGVGLVAVIGAFVIGLKQIRISKKQNKVALGIYEMSYLDKDIEKIIIKMDKISERGPDQDDTEFNSLASQLHNKAKQYNACHNNIIK